MNQNILPLVKQYLESRSSNALLITGEWGVGKTFYFNSILKNKISEISTFEDNSKKYKPILISLFGIKSIDEIKSEIVLSLFPFFKDPKIKTGAAIGKTVLKGLLSFKGLEFVTNALTDLNIVNDVLINLDKIVLCFDDLERKSKSLEIEELIGFINSIVENNNNKVIIIANEENLKDKNYNLFKEKLIGTTIEFIPDLNNVFEIIIETNFPGYEFYKEFLKEHKEYIINIFSKKSKNLRILIFSLSCFQNIYSQIDEELNSDKNLKENKKEILLNILKFTLAISIEFKLRNISYNERNELDTSLPEFYWSVFRQIKGPEKEDKTKRDIFIEEYYINGNFKFYSSIYEYITGGMIFNSNSLHKELKLFFSDEKTLIPPHIKVFNQLQYTNCFKLDDKNYIENTKSLLQYAYEGEFELNLYWLIFHFAMRFENPLKLNPEELESKIIRGIKKCKKKQKHNHQLEFELSKSSVDKYQNHIEKINNTALLINTEIVIEKEKNEFKTLEELCYTNYEEFYKKVTSQEYSYGTKPFFAHFNSSNFYKFFVNSNPERRFSILQFFENRYENDLVYLKKEITFISLVKKKMEANKCQKGGKNVKGYIFSRFTTLLSETIKKLNQYPKI